MKIFTVSQIKELDQYTIDHEPISSLDLMERASGSFVDAFTEEVLLKERIVVFAGPGNNGGDALAISRLLIQKGYSVTTYLLNTSGKISTECELNKARLLNLRKEFFSEITEKLPEISLNRGNIIIDGLFGSGLNKPLSGIYAEIVKKINDSKLTVYSIDVPSGLFGENNNINAKGNIIKATKTFTFQSPKLAFFMPENECYVGGWKVLDIGLHPTALKQWETPYFYLERADANKIIRPRSKFAYKNNFGHALIVAGSKGKMGAAVLAAKATLKSGAGLLTVHLPGRGEQVLQSVLPEAMVELDVDNDIITGVIFSDTFTSLGIGPGIGRAEPTINGLRKILKQFRKPLVLDADALNIMAQDKSLIKLIPAYSILTPHIGEFERLTEKFSSSHIRLENARRFARENNCIVVLKGAYTAICFPDNKVSFNSTGNAGMATAGSGDVLTGIITGLLCQSYSPFEAAKLGVYIHGLAGDFAAEKNGEESLIAGDIIESLGKAFKHMR